MVWKMKKENNPTVPIQKYKEMEIMREKFLKKPWMKYLGDMQIIGVPNGGKIRREQCNNQRNNRRIL